MSFARRLLGLMLTLLLVGTVVTAQTPRSTEDPRNLAPTVNGGTGLFTVYDAQTLRKGEFNFGFFANHFHRDPGDIAFQNYPINFQVGFSDHFELFVNWTAQQVVAVGRPALLSGFYLPDVRTNTLPAGRLVIVPGQNAASVLVGDPCGNGGFPGPCVIPGSRNLAPFTARPSGNDTAVYVGLGAPVGGILPALLPNVNPSYYPNAPFLSRFADSHPGGDVLVGGKIRFTGPKNPFGFTLIPLVKIPYSRTLNTGLQRGRGTGAWDYGVIAAFDGRLHKYINLSTNIGFIKKGDPRAEDMELGPLCAGCGVIQGYGRSERALDLPNELRAGIGFDFPVSKYLQFVAEVSSTHWVGSRTPSLLQNSPVDLIAGARIYPHRWLAIHAAFQRHLNWLSEFDLRSPNGFIAGLSIGHVNERVEPILPNQPPTVNMELGAVTRGSDDLLRESATTVCAGDQVALRAVASDPDGDTLLYGWSTTGGRISGEGVNTTFDTTGLAPGDYTITVQVDDGCGCVAFDSKTIRVTSCPPLTVCFGPNLDVTADQTSVDAGVKVNFSTSGVTGGRNYGNVRYEWSSTAGNISGSNMSAQLDTTGVTGGTTIEVTVKAISDAGNCSASGSARISITVPPAPVKPRASELGECRTFRTNNGRVDNACKDVLSNQVIPALQADPGAKVVIDGYRGEKERPADLDLQRAKNVRDRLADGGLGTAIDANRIVVRPSGVSSDGSQIKIWLVPSGADDPAGAAAVDPGPVTPERGRRGRRR